jgi:predicted Fe-S protein YdhL (DUF1289 family)
MSKKLSSPCIGICSTVYGDDFCRGCKRHYLEVINWNGYDEEKKQKIYTRLLQQIQQIVTPFITVIDADKLLHSLLQANGQQPLLYEDAYYWAYELLRLSSEEIVQLEHHGLQATANFQSLSAKTLFTQIDDQLYAVAMQ